MKRFLLFFCTFFCFLVYAQAQEAESENYDDILEGEGLTIEAATDPAKEAVSGISVVLNKEQMKTTAQIGLVEDAMSSVQTLPGVTYSGSWESEPSIRGGYPREMTTVLDGVYLLYPWHWGSAYSIFNPHMVDTVKMSNGVFSARYGRALSGLMEVSTVVPDNKFHLDLNLTDIATDIFAQIPLGSKAGIFTGGKITYIEGYLAAFRAMAPENELTDMVAKAPYIRDFYTKGYFNPTDKLNFVASGFFGSDGIKIDQDESKDGHKSDGVFDYMVNQAFGNVSAKWLVTPKFQLKGNVAYNWMLEDLSLDMVSEGWFKYTDAFINQYGSLLDEESLSKRKYYLPKQTDHMAEKITNHMVQGRIESELEINQNHTIIFGGEEVWSRSDCVEQISAWSEHNTFNEPFPRFEKLNGKIDVDGNNMFTTGGFGAWSFGGDTTLVSGELGLRVDHLYIRNKNEDLTINTKPHFNPRASIQFTPWRYKNGFEKVTFSAGTGLFSSTSLETMMVSGDMKFDPDDISQNRAVFAVLGTELKFPEEISFKLEGYYKHYLNRLYNITDDRDPRNMVIHPKTDGKGEVAGFDLMLEKKKGKYFDGYLSYSFVYARYKNPFTPMYANQKSGSGDPLDEWYYPTFHRFHTLNAVANFKPNEHWTITVKGTLASGTPKYEEGDIYCYPAKLSNGTIVQRYTRNYTYSDTDRIGISCPIDVRVGYKKDLPKRGELEWYVGAEDIFQNIYSPEGYEEFDKRTGEMTNATTNANFSIGIPLVSVGVKVSL